MEQNLKNHTRYIPLYHFVAGTMLLAITIGAARNLFRSLHDEDRLYNASLILAITLLLWFIFFFTRAFALKAQDRVIMLEERLRYQQLTGKTLSAGLRPSQIIALRFASDAEFAPLADRAAAENMSSKEIKLAIRNWRGDYYRV